MGRIRGFLILILTSGLILFFQNCAKAPTTLELDEALNQPGPTTGSLKVTSNVRLLNSGGSQQALKANRFVNPIAIRFGAIAHDFSYQFPYSLKIESGEIVDASTGAHVDQLTASEADQLDQILDGAVVASRRDFMDPGIMCATVMVEGYSALLTDQGTVILGHGTSSCDVSDLLRDDAGGNEAGLKAFLQNLNARL